MSEAFGVNLKEKAVNGDRDSLEEAWLEALEKPGPASDFLEALDALEQGMRKECSLALLPLVIETYDGLGRYDDALQVCERMVQYKSIDRALRRTLVKSLKETHKGTDWIEALLHATGLLEGDPMDACMARFDAYLAYRPGCGVIHGSGWGSGVVEGFNEDTWEIRVRFEDGCRRELPLSSAVDNLRPLDAGDLRIMVMTQPDELKEMARKDPALAIRKALSLRPKVKLTAAKVKEILVGQVVPAEEWSRWWTRAKQAAAKDPYLLLEGGSRPVFQLRDKPVSIQEEAMASLEETADLTETVEKVREYLATKPDKELKKALLEEIRDQVAEGIEAEEEAGQLLEGTLLLEEKGIAPPKPSREIMAEMLGPAEVDKVRDATEIFDALDINKSQALALGPFQEAFHEDWPLLLSQAYPRLPQNLLDPAADLLVKKGHGELLMIKFGEMAQASWRWPWPLFHLGRRIAGGTVNDIPGVPTVSQVALAMLKCIESSLFHTTGSIHYRRNVMHRFEELFFDTKRMVLRRFMEEGTEAELRRAFSMIHATSKLPEEVQDYLRSEIEYRYPEMVARKEVPFWEEDFIYCSRAGILRRSAELKDITDVKLDANAKAIGKAAALGDLSENAEWSAAIEEQRLLTEKAGQIQDELGNVRPIEEQSIPKGKVAPGTRVTIRRTEDGTEESFSILGPWDAGVAGVISYQAPLATSLLGKKVGEEATVTLPGKSFDVVVLAVEPILFAE